MSRYDVFPGSIDGSLLLDVQADLLDEMSTRVVVPLMERSAAPKAADRLNPEFAINGKQYVMVTQLLATVPASLLRQSVSNLSPEFAKISGALDFLFQGY